MALTEQDRAIDGILPPAGEEIEDIAFVRAAQDACAGLPGHAEVRVVGDTELGSEIVEMVGQEAGLDIQVQSILPLLVLHAKAAPRFFWISIGVVDDRNCFRTITLSNKTTIANLEGNRALLPAEIGEGWQRLCLDLSRLVQNAFGAGLLATVHIRVRGSISLSKIYFQGQDYSDAELPDYLRALS